MHCGQNTKSDAVSRCKSNHKPVNTYPPPSDTSYPSIPSFFLVYLQDYRRKPPAKHRCSGPERYVMDCCTRVSERPYDCFFKTGVCKTSGFMYFVFAFSQVLSSSSEPSGKRGLSVLHCRCAINYLWEPYYQELLESCDTRLSIQAPNPQS